VNKEFRKIPKIKQVIKAHNDVGFFLLINF